MRLEFLRSYYAALIDGRYVERFRDATFEEYVEVLKRTYPLISQRGAAQMGASNGRPDFSKAAESMPAPLPVAWIDQSEAHLLAKDFAHLILVGQHRLDLRSAVAGKGLRVLDARGCQVRGWEGLAGSNWRLVDLSFCTTDELPRLAPAVVCEKLVINFVARAVAEALARSTRCQAFFCNNHKEPFDLAALEDQNQLLELNVIASSLGNVGKLTSRRFSTLRLAGLFFDSALQALLAGNAASLTNVALDCSFSPADLPLLPQLAQMQVPVASPNRESWLEYALARPHVYFNFTPATLPVKKPRKFKVAQFKPAKMSLWTTNAEAPPSLARLAEVEWFESWTGEVEPHLVRASRKLICQAARELEALAHGASLAAEREVLARCVGHFNRLEERYNFIGSTEAEEIVMAIEKLAALTLVRDEKELVDTLGRQW